MAVLSTVGKCLYFKFVIQHISKKGMPARMKQVGRVASLNYFRESILSDYLLMNLWCSANGKGIDQFPFHFCDCFSADPCFPVQFWQNKKSELNSCRFG